MTQNGILIRSACTTVIKSQPPKRGEMVFVEDTGQHAWLDPDGNVVFAWLDGRGLGENYVLKGSANPTPDIGTDGDKYMQAAQFSDDGLYTEYTKNNNEWEKIKFYRILNADPQPTDYPDDPQGTIYYVT